MNSDKRDMNPSDHELLITHSSQLSQACKMISDTNKSLTDFIIKIDTRCEDRRDLIQDTRDVNMKTGTFWKILSILVVVLITMLGVMNYNREISLKNEIRITHLTKITEKNGQLLEELLKGLISDRHDANERRDWNAK